MRSRRDKRVSALWASTDTRFSHPESLANKINPIYAGLGEKDLAFESLQTAFNEHSILLPRMKVDPLLDQLRTDSRFAGLTRRLGLEP